MASVGPWARVRGVLLAAVVVGVLPRCATSEDTEGSGGRGSGGQGASAAAAGAGGATGGASGSAGAGATGGTLQVDAQGDYTADQFFIEDPPPANCDGGGQPVVPGGTPECPDDKNLPGCACQQSGATAPCWPGKRANRNRGDCADGMTVCGYRGEQLQWGECVGFTGLDPNTLLPYGTTGKAACGCFSAGFWDIENVSPCFYSTSPTTVVGAASTVPPGDCVPAAQLDFNTGVGPTAAFSPNTITADCTGQFELCFTLRALSTPAGTPSTTDCVMKRVCTSAYYAQANVAQAFPDLPGWITATAQEKACAQAFVDNGGYADLSVDGESDECDRVQKDFARFTYCPFKCSDAANAQDPECVNCTNGGGGPF